MLSLKMQANPISIIVFLLGITLALIALYAWQHRSTRGSRMFSIFISLITLYVLGYSMELASLDLPSMLFWSKIEYLGTCSFPNLFLLFVLQYTNHEEWLTWKNILLLFLCPFILMIAKLFDETWHLVYSTAWVDTNGPIPMLGFTRGPLYMLALYAILPVGLGIVLLLQKRKNSQTLYKKQIAIVIASVLPPLLVFILYISSFRPFPNLEYLDVNAFLFPLWGIGIAWVIYRYRLLDLAPVAQETLIRHLNDGILVLDDQYRLVDANPAALKMMGWGHPPIGQDASIAFADWEELKDLCKVDDLEKAPSDTTIRHQIRGKSLFFDISNTSLRDREGEKLGQLIVMHDITEMKRLEERLLELSLTDDLTGLNNRRGFYYLTEQFIQMVKRMQLKAAIIFIDMDNLKTINDTFGHAEGNRALMDIANLLRHICRSSDILARIGGDEFVVLGLETAADSAETMLSRFENELFMFNQCENREYSIEVSCGVAHYNIDQPCLIEELLEQADRMMYKNKQAKRTLEPPVKVSSDNQKYSK